MIWIGTPATGTVRSANDTVKFPDLLVAFYGDINGGRCRLPRVIERLEADLVEAIQEQRGVERSSAALFPGVLPVAKGVHGEA